MEKMDTDFYADEVDSNTILVTASKDEAWIRQHEVQILKSALEQYSTKGQSSVLPTDSTTSQEITLDYIDELSRELNSSVSNLITANDLIRQKVLSDGYFGVIYESVVKNICTDCRFFYGAYENDEDSAETLSEIKDIITYFNKAIGLKHLIRDAISIAFLEGNYVMYMRISKDARPVIDWYPLTIAYPSDYLYDHRSVIELSIDNLKSRLRKTYSKNKKGRAIYAENAEKEIKDCYPAEVYKAYKDGEKVVKLDPRYSTCVKFNDMGRKLGVSPLFRGLKPLIILEQIEAADVSDSKARSKKILFQPMRKETMGEGYTHKGFADSKHAHDQGAQSLKADFNLYTPIPQVEDLRYVQAKAQSEDSINQQKLYTQKLLTSLGIGFTDMDATVSAGKISVSQLLRTINAIGESFEDAMHLFYRTYLEDLGYDPEMAPEIRVIDAEQMEMDVAKDIASFLYGTLGFSRQTAAEAMGYSIQDEKARREAENDAGYENIFYPRATSYTSNGERQSAGRPQSNEDENKRDYDQNYTENAR